MSIENNNINNYNNSTNNDNNSVIENNDNSNLSIITNNSNHDQNILDSSQSNDINSMSDNIEVNDYNNYDTTKNSTSLLNNSSSSDFYHPIEEVSKLLEKYHVIKNKDHEALTKEEHSADLNNLDEITDNLTKYFQQDNTLLHKVNDINSFKDKKNYMKNKENSHFATYNKYTDKEDDTDEYGNSLMSRKYLDKLICTNPSLYYRTHELNDSLYLHFKSFKQINNLNSFINLKVLYLENNCISKIENLDSLTYLSGLYLQENMIEKIENLDKLKYLNTLNLSDNRIKKIENLENNKKLTTLILKRNYIGESNEGLQGLLTASNTISVLDISDNNIKEANILDNILTKMEGLRVIYLNGNDCTRKIPSYRKTMIYKIKELRYIDDKPVFEDERRFAEAFGRGGLEEERKDRELYRKEQKDLSLKRIKDFQDMVSCWKKKKPEEESFEENKENYVNKDNEKTKNKLELLNSMKQKLQESRKHNINNNIFNETDQNTNQENKSSILNVKDDSNDNIDNNNILDKEDNLNINVPLLEEVKDKYNNVDTQQEWNKAKLINNSLNNLLTNNNSLSTDENIIDVNKTNENNLKFDELD